KPINVIRHAEGAAIESDAIYAQIFVGAPIAGLGAVTPIRPNSRDWHPMGTLIGLALGGGFARGIAHAGVLRVFERHGIPLHCITGVSAGSIVAAAYASGSGPAEIAAAASSLRIRDVARWSLCRMGFMGTERMKRFLEGLLKTRRFEEMRI